MGVDLALVPLVRYSRSAQRSRSGTALGAWADAECQAEAKPVAACAAINFSASAVVA
jgi:hypothetical protein